MPRLVSNTSRIFYCVREGDIESLKEILCRGLASPLDVDVTNGDAALSVNQCPRWACIQLTLA